MSKTRPSDAAVEHRRQEILDHVIATGEVRIDDLTTRFGVSLMTMHRDLDDLADRRLLRKLRGKVEAYPATTMESAARFRDTFNQATKDALGDAAAAHVHSGQTVFVDDSTTLFPLVRRLAQVEDLTVITNSLEAARILGPAKSVEVVVAGRYHHEFDSCGKPGRRRVPRPHARRHRVRLGRRGRGRPPVPPGPGLRRAQEGRPAHRRSQRPGRRQLQVRPHRHLRVRRHRRLRPPDHRRRGADRGDRGGADRGNRHRAGRMRTGGPGI